MKSKIEDIQECTMIDKDGGGCKMIDVNGVDRGEVMMKDDRGRWKEKRGR